MTSNLSLANIDSKIRFARKISEIDSFRPYGSNEDIVSNYAYLGHFLVLCNQLGAVNYALFRRCFHADKLEAEREYFSSFSEAEQRQKARSAILLKISENPELTSGITEEVNSVYDSIDDFFVGLAAKKFKNAEHIRSIQFCESVFGMPCSENYEKNIAELPIKTASMYVLLQRISNIHDTISSHYGWEEKVESGFT
ncbi:hypothetical protein [Paracoccus marcusii]|uniref:hypothetical protein n=1 Tax=Paracoccus marcusii TaxID=59779 RepID=UPI0011124CD2|nr:hypothetical protein [Paracoccus marcusii]TNC05543.1 hypothetical protein FHD68_03530 [Paracoccus marcusii]